MSFKLRRKINCKKLLTKEEVNIGKKRDEFGVVNTGQCSV
jgi:hypothetical protein